MHANENTWIIESVIVVILIFLIVIAAAALVFAMVYSSHKEEADNLVTESVTAWRSSNLDVDEFDVQVSHSSVSQVFSVFPQAEQAYVTPESVEEEWNRVMELEREASRYVKTASAPVVDRVVEKATKKRKNETKEAAA